MQLEELGRVAQTVTIEDFGGGAEFLTRATASLSPGKELHIADVIGKIERVEEVPSRYPGANGEPRNSILLHGYFETILRRPPSPGKVAGDESKITSLSVWLPGDFPEHVARYFRRRFEPIGQTMDMAVSVYAVKLREEGRQRPYCYRVRTIGGAAERVSRR